jgi:hypothetical protein
MMLSDAILQGAKWLRPARARSQGCGHVIDLAEYGFGGTPILGPYLQPVVWFPCACTRVIEKGRFMRLTLLEMVVHLFTEHVITVLDWTIGTLIDWLADRERELGFTHLEYYAPYAFGRLF